MPGVRCPVGAKDKPLPYPVWDGKGSISKLLMVVKVLDELPVLPRLVALGKQVEVFAAGVPDVVLQLIVLHFTTVQKVAGIIFQLLAQLVQVVPVDVPIV